MKYCKVLVVGGAGYIGGYATDTLMKAGFDVLVYDNLLYEDRYLKPVPFVFGDIRDTEKVLKCAQGCDVVVLLAAMVGDAACNVNPDLTEAINFQAIKDICEKLPLAKQVVFASTCSVYGANDDYVDEDSEVKPLSCYASTKLRSEEYVLDRGGCVFRLGTVYGVGDHFSRIRADLVVNTLTIKAFAKGEITVNGGDQWRPIISVKDVSGYIEEACRKEIPGIFNLSFTNTKIKDLAAEIKSVFPEVKVNYIDAMFQDERNYKVSNSRSVLEFDYEPLTTVKEEVYNLAQLLREGRIKDPANINYNNGLFVAQQRL